MAKEKLIQSPPESDETQPHQRFQVFASKIVQVTKTEIDERERIWREAHGVDGRRKSTPVAAGSGAKKKPR